LQKGDTIKPMADFKSKPGSFLPLLEYSERKDRPVQPAQKSPLDLLGILARQAQQSLPLFDLQTLTSMDPSRYAEALKALKNSGYITIEGDAPEQMVRLTGSGSEVVRLGRPA
jgi:hypothetical protein